MGKMRRPLFWLLTALLVFGIVEAMARLTHHWLYGQSVDVEADVAGLRAVQRNRRNAVSGGRLQPFYGIVGSRTPDLNMPPSSLSSRRLAATSGGRDAVVIGLVGGSVAADVAGNLAGQLLTHFANGSDDVTVWPVFIDLTFGGFRQPQQSLVFTNLLANDVQFDIVMSLDGFNEVWLSAEGYETSGTHPNWPLLWSAAVGANADSRALAAIMALKGEQQALTLFPRFARSALFDLARRYRLDQINRLIVARHFDLAAAGQERHILARQGPFGAFTREQVRNVATEAWYRSVLLLAGIAERHGAEYYHFLQPSQYVPGAKPLSDDELAHAYRRRSLWADAGQEGYPKLIEYGTALEEQGVKFFDLSHIFADHHETLYVDQCCHLNRRGNELLAQHMLRHLLDNGALGPRLSAAKPDNQVPSRHQAVLDSIAKGEFGAPAARSVFDIYRKGRTLAYLKRHCTVAHITTSFFVQFPRNDGHMTTSRFHFTRHGDILEGSGGNEDGSEGNICVAIFELSDTGIGRLRTGQFWESHKPGGSLEEEWSVEVDATELNTL